MTLPATLTRLADAAVSARDGADLFRLSWADRTPSSALKANSDGSFTITGMDLLKVGLFNGVVSIVEGDLETMVTQFRALRDAGVFVPPYRLDHSWSVTYVVGWFEELETYRRVDTTDNLEKLFLRGDVRITGSLDYTPAQIIAAIKGGVLRNRSSELGGYVTNAGVEIPLVYYGCAYVDIPAVEGLAPVQLSHATRSNPQRITNLTAETEETHVMDPRKLARLKALRGLVAGGSTLSDAGSTELAELENEATEAQVDEAAVEAADDEPEDLSVLEPDAPEVPAVDPPAEVDPPPAETHTPEETAGDAAEVEQLRARVAAAEAEATRLRTAEIDRSIETLRTAGAIVPEIEEDAVALLRHTDEDVRRRAGAVLGNLGGRVNLTRRPGRTTSEADQLDASTGNAIEFPLDMSGNEAGELWASLSTEQRKLSAASWAAFTKHRQENGIRD